MLYRMVLLLLATPIAVTGQNALLGAAQTAGHGELTASAAGALFVFRTDIDGVPRTLEGNDDVAAFFARAAFGVSPHADVVGSLTVAEDIIHLGGELKYQVWQGTRWSLAATGGAHADRFHTDFVPEWFHINGLDAGAVVSAEFSPRVTAYLGGRSAFEFADVDLMRDNAPKHLDHFTRLTVVPGIEFRLGPRSRLVAELGAKLNDEATSYLAAGFTLSLR